MITYFKDKNNKQKKIKKNKMLTTIIESIDAFAIITTTSISVVLNATGMGLITIPISSGRACGLAISNKIIYETFMQKYNKYRKEYEKDQQSIKSFDKLYENRLQDIVIDKKEYESLCILFTKYLDETKN